MRDGESGIWMAGDGGVWELSAHFWNGCWEGFGQDGAGFGVVLGVHNPSVVYTIV